MAGLALRRRPPPLPNHRLRRRLPSVERRRCASRTPTAADLPAIRDLLARSSLPWQDLGCPNQTSLVARDEDELAGCVGLEAYGAAALLRFPAVPSSRWGCGLGTALHERAVELARQAGIVEVFLLTTTADRFFLREGCTRVARSCVPAAVLASRELRTLYPSTAVCMSRRLG